MKNFRDLKVWEKSHELTLAAYEATANFPEQEMFGLVSQIRRCASSIPANIAEGMWQTREWRISPLSANCNGISQ
ncbi:MAG TPA: four helix bundle protein [Candidatus Angelobacter sp.]|nr:four helix bundle protein [Candidatus Angelobacter sp.]